MPLTHFIKKIYLFTGSYKKKCADNTNYEKVFKRGIYYQKNKKMGHLTKSKKIDPTILYRTIFMQDCMSVFMNFRIKLFRTLLTYTVGELGF